MRSKNQKISRAEWRRARNFLDQEQPAHDRKWPTEQWIRALRVEGVEDTRLKWLRAMLHPTPTEQIPKSVVDAFVAVHGEAWREDQIARKDRY